MEVLNFSEFQKEIERIGLKNPKIKFDFRSIKIITSPYFDDILIQLIFWLGSFIFLFDNTFLLPSFFIFCGSWYFFYMNFIGLDILK